ncbi:hypothetical protein Dda_4384 [Drechslerella dactyloides]|uniref:Uncharacterized protein n=1 Tax=Drechslerella dactyloides TaxID=74499 RepID=A0AAD6J111_DREDA|nr:hypothetical protein Dda_4384 [Drechslerella dactyloides]
MSFVVAAMMMAVEVCGAEEEWSNRCREVFRSLDGVFYWLGSVEDMANQLLLARSDDSMRCVGKRWAGNFVKRCPELQTRLSRKYDYQRVKCEDPVLISKWFQLIKAVKTKYGIADNDIYNFDKTGFTMGIISTTTVVTGAETCDKAKLAQPRNHKWVTIIQGIGAEG